MITRVNVRKVKVSKAALLVPVLGSLLVPMPAVRPLQLPAAPFPTALGLEQAATAQGGSRSVGTCGARRAPRFEMISVDADPPAGWRDPTVCLAVYIR
jgi:hypothetical protein